LRSYLELWYLETVNPLDETKGYGRFKLWTGAVLFTLQFSMKLEMVNVIFAGKTRLIIIIMSLLVLSFNIMRM